MLPDSAIDMITISGQPVNFAAPESTKIDTLDLFVHTCNTCRYNGAVKCYLVQHLDLCALLTEEHIVNEPSDLSEEERSNRVIVQSGFAAAHDLHEVYIGDMVSGLKKYVPRFNEIEHRWEKHIHKELGLPLEFRDEALIKHVDALALVVEMTALKHPAAGWMSSKHNITANQSHLEIFKNIIEQSPYTTWFRVWKRIVDARHKLASLGM